jgi:hypothetical protein
LGCLFVPIGKFDAKILLFTEASKGFAAKITEVFIIYHIQATENKGENLYNIAPRVVLLLSPYTS